MEAHQVGPALKECHDVIDAPAGGGAYDVATAEDAKDGHIHHRRKQRSYFSGPADGSAAFICYGVDQAKVQIWHNSVAYVAEVQTLAWYPVACELQI